MPSGEVYGLLGPNGAGKTTLAKQAIGLLKPTAGRIMLGPFDLVADPDAARQLCSYLPQAPMPIDSYRVREAIELTGRIRGGDRASVRRRAGELIEALDIGEWEHVMGQRLSGGIKRLVGFAMVTVWPGRVVILDEPTNDVDPLRRRLLWDRIRLLGQHGCSVLLVTHNVMEAENRRSARYHLGRPPGWWAGGDKARKAPAADAASPHSRVAVPGAISSLSRLVMRMILSSRSGGDISRSAQSACSAYLLIRTSVSRPLASQKLRDARSSTTRGTCRSMTART